jgi:hypothetical protein
MSFTMDISSYPTETECDKTNAGHDEEIMFFGRAIEIFDTDPVYQQQLNLPLFSANESVHYLTQA